MQLFPSETFVEKTLESQVEELKQRLIPKPPPLPPPTPPEPGKKSFFGKKSKTTRTQSDSVAVLKAPKKPAASMSGAVPQLANMTSLMEEMKKKILQRSQSASGMGVLKPAEETKPVSILNS